MWTKNLYSLKPELESAVWTLEMHDLVGFPGHQISMRQYLLWIILYLKKGVKRSWDAHMCPKSKETFLWYAHLEENHIKYFLVQELSNSYDFIVEWH